MPLHLIISEKFNAKQEFERVEARIVIGGNLQAGIEDIETHSHCIRNETVFLLFSVAAHRQHYVRSVDIKTAYLNTPIASRDVYAIMKRTIAEYMIRKYPELQQWQDRRGYTTFKVVKALYGLAEAARLWHLYLVDFLTKIQYQVSEFDKAPLFRRDFLGVTFILVYVDDILIIGNDEASYTHLIGHLHPNLTGLTQQRGTDIHFLRMLIEIRPHERAIYVSKVGHVKKLLENYNVTKAYKTPCDLRVLEPDDSPSLPDFALSGIIMEIRYLIDYRPDLHFTLHVSTKSMHKPTRNLKNSRIAYLAISYTLKIIVCALPLKIYS
jgi:hypothetical protein